MTLSQSSSPYIPTLKSLLAAQEEWLSEGTIDAVYAHYELLDFCRVIGVIEKIPA